MTFAVLLAAGSSSRFRDTCPADWPQKDKLQYPIGGVPLWRRSFDALRGHPCVDGVGVVCSAGTEDTFSEADFAVPGGQTRLDSARIGVEMSPSEAEVVLVHDAARPFPSSPLISRVIEAAREHGAAIPAVPVTDTLKRGSEWVAETINREGLFRVQTPQAARRDWLLAALRGATQATDEAMALKEAGYRVRMVEGDERNIKVTTVQDLSLMTAVTTTGFGYDIHRFAAGRERPLVLGGVTFEGVQGLEGHSDADVALHAATDALLGACGFGDIGEHFPDTDPKWRNADSRIFLREAMRMVRESGGELESLDLTILAEKPKISGRREDIRRAIAQELGVEARRINVKATTGEGIGAIGRGEGIAAMAVAAVSRHTI